MTPGNMTRLKQIENEMRTATGPELARLRLERLEAMRDEAAGHLNVSPARVMSAREWMRENRCTKASFATRVRELSLRTTVVGGATFIAVT